MHKIYYNLTAHEPNNTLLNITPVYISLMDFTLATKHGLDSTHLVQENIHLQLMTIEKRTEKKKVILCIH